MQPSSSPAGHWNSTDLYKSLRGALVTYAAGLGFEILMDLKNAAEQCVNGVCAVDLGIYDFLWPMAVSTLGFLIEMYRRRVTDYSLQ